ncbi:MAG: DL-methionine transporter ATP-binding subunit [Gammaproteobacteria bacterium RIFCSPHIGHO2_12_FULL_35_23]|nr:MAG: DL-methionine transporter ATP-binding subunit [Gammaproteobacteria bacterium RIFCSPHIGHO2_12_FULL_35_23]
MIEVKNLTKNYDDNSIINSVLTNINLTIAQGEIFGIIGRSGAGKSTLVHCMNLLEKPTSGEIIINGVNLLDLSTDKLRQARQKIGMIFQHFNLLSSRTVFENVALPLELSHLSKKIIRDKVFGLLELVDLSQKIDAYPDDLSGGQKQRVAIARALASEPTVLLSDEATSALDPETTNSILKLLKEINKKLNLTMVIVTHEMAVIKTICDRVAVLDQGKIVEQGRVIDLFIQPVHIVTKKLTQAVLHLELPIAIRDKIKPQPTSDCSNPIVRIGFIGSSTNEPLLVTLYQQFNVIANIIQADLEFIQNSLIGVSICEFRGKPEAVLQALKYLETQNLKVEILGYA